MKIYKAGNILFDPDIVVIGRHPGAATTPFWEVYDECHLPNGVLLKKEMKNG